MSDNRCVCCGAIIPEGRQVCYRCEKGKFKRFGALLTASALMLSMSHPTIVKAYQHDMGTLMRDVNFDGVVDGRDASAVLSEYANVSVGNEPLFTETQKYIADTNEDGMITATDDSDIITYYMNESCNKPIEPQTVMFSVMIAEPGKAVRHELYRSYFAEQAQHYINCVTENYREGTELYIVATKTSWGNKISSQKCDIIKPSE